MPDLLDVFPSEKRALATELDAIFREVTGWNPILYGKVLGYGAYHYRYASGHEGNSYATGFTLRSRDISLYIMPGYSDFPEIAARLGKHKRGKACWYIPNLENTDRIALADLIKAGVDDLRTQFDVQAT